MINQSLINYCSNVQEKQGETHQDVSWILESYREFSQETAQILCARLANWIEADSQTIAVIDCWSWRTGYLQQRTIKQKQKLLYVVHNAGSNPVMQSVLRHTGDLHSIKACKSWAMLATRRHRTVVHQGLSFFDDRSDEFSWWLDLSESQFVHYSLHAKVVQLKGLYLFCQSLLLFCWRQEMHTIYWEADDAYIDALSYDVMELAILRSDKVAPWFGRICEQHTESVITEQIFNIRTRL